MHRPTKHHKRKIYAREPKNGSLTFCGRCKKWSRCFFPLAKPLRSTAFIALKLLHNLDNPASFRLYYVICCSNTKRRVKFHFDVEFVGFEASKKRCDLSYVERWKNAENFFAWNFSRQLIKSEVFKIFPAALFILPSSMGIWLTSMKNARLNRYVHASFIIALINREF